MKRIMCYFGLHKWTEDIVTIDLPTDKNKGHWTGTHQRRCKHCGALRDRLKEDRCYVYMQQNKEEVNKNGGT